jgi:hypothetical protein
MSLQQRFKKSPPPPITVSSRPIAGVHAELHYKVPELAKLWGCSDHFIRDLFKNEIGVLKIVRPEDVRRNKREYVSLRIPANVAAKVHESLHGTIQR